MRTFVLALVVALALAGPSAGAASAAETPAPVLVPAEWLSAHLSDPGLVVLHVGGLRADYDREHIPGARYVWLNWLAESTPERSFEMPATKAAEERLERLGISDDSRIVVYFQLGDVTGAARAYVTLDHLRLGDRTSMLDGGLDAWKAAGRPVSAEEPRVRRGRLTLRPGRALIGADEVLALARESGTRLVDARSRHAYDGTPGTAVFRGGHIPGAVHLAATALTDSTDRFLPADSLRARFERAGVKPGDTVIAYCAVGRSASPLYVAAKLLGHPVRLYDGSYEEWSRRLDLPIEAKAAK